MTYWLGRLFIVLSLMASWDVQAVLSLDTSPSVLTWCTSSGAMTMTNRICNFPTEIAAVQKTITLVNEFSLQQHTANPTISLMNYTLISCDGKGNCSTCLTFTEIRQPTTYTCGQIAVWAELLPSCPPPKSHPEIPYLYNRDGNICYRYIPDNPTLTIILSGGSEVEPSDNSTTNTLPFIATVIDQNTGQPTTNPVQVHISLKVDPTSGGHDHGDSTRPRGSVADVQSCDPFGDGICWSNPTKNGAVVFNFNPTYASGTHTITATCDGCSNTATAPVNVKVKEADAASWDHLTASPDYALVGGDAGKTHHDNHYLTATARDHLQKLVNKYNTKYPQGPVLYLNDSSLVWGGKFDISGKWAGDHKNHRRGVVIDIRANQNPTAIPQARFTKFERLAAESSAYADLHCAFSGRYVCPACLLDTAPNRHYHVRLLGKSIDK